MILRVAFFVLMALGLVGFGTVAWVTTRPPATARAAEPPPRPKTIILVAARTVHAGSLLKPEDLAGKEFAAGEPAASDGTPDSVEARRELVGAMVRRGLAAGDVVRNGDVMRPGDHGFLAAVLMPGMRAVTISVDNTTGSAGLIWPGDRVDLILTQTIGEPSVPLGRRVAAETVLGDIRVLAIDQQIVQGAAPTSSDSHARTVTLEVTPEQAERISVAGRLGRLSLSVRSADGIQQAAARPGGADATWASDVSRALGVEIAHPADNVIRIFQGAQEPKEFKF
jgi:pilus assembly protein CpaB